MPRCGSGTAVHAGRAGRGQLLYLVPAVPLWNDLRSGGHCVDRVRLIRAVYAKGRAAAKKGKRLGQVDERSMKRAEDILHGELAVALNIPVDGVKDYISNVLNGSQAS